ncbi:hypothetical protein [Glutamicibacter ardleyensis]|uniref:hypothetical protein n=1 Tax=Glutamicibacter ardleyensis TaxID=225894 RepID=UPI003FCFEA19
MFSHPHQPVSTIVYVQNGVTMETGRIGGTHQNVKDHAQDIIDRHYGGGHITLIKYF